MLRDFVYDFDLVVGLNTDFVVTYLVGVSSSAGRATPS